MARTRRAILKTGGAIAVIIGAGAGAWALTRAPKLAREPWSKAGAGFGDARLDALSFAILAPNPHNMQPWRIRLEGEDALTVHCDPTRLLPETDPPNRQITIGFGCFLELLSQAAAEKGLRADIAPFPEGEPQPHLDRRPIASVRFVPDTDVRGDPLFAAALSRRTCREPFTADKVAPEELQRILAARTDGVEADGAVAGEEIETLKTLAKDAWKIEWGLDRTRRESIAVTRIGKAEIDADPWGIALAGPVMEAAGLAGVLTRENMDDASKAAFSQSLDFYNRAVDTAAAFVWTSTATNTRADQLAAGRSWLRMHEAATLLGLSVQPLSQALQEFPEMSPAYDRAHEMLAHQAGATVQMLARLGRAPVQPPAPRLALAAVLIKA
jgi:hypothetical protein